VRVGAVEYATVVSLNEVELQPGRRCASSHAAQLLPPPTLQSAPLPSAQRLRPRPAPPPQRIQRPQWLLLLPLAPPPMHVDCHVRLRCCCCCRRSRNRVCGRRFGISRCLCRAPLLQPQQMADRCASAPC